jgi:CheY-like chemotaxis protein
MGYTELAQMQQDNPERLSYNLKEIEAATIRARDLVRQILTFSRKSGQEKKLMRMSLVVKEALKLLRSTIPTSIEFREDIISEGQVLADATQIHQIIMNLCTNAFHAMRDDNGGVLTVSLNSVVMAGHHSAQGVEFADGEYLHLQVNDTGKGMDQQTLANIFEPYFTSKGIGEGTGLGLAVVHGIVKGHGGYITVDSEVGQGSTFHVYLPLYEVEEQVDTGKSIMTDSATGHGRILFVDDEQNITSVAQEFFSSCGYEISCFNEPVQGLEAFKKQPELYDILITDMAMPMMTGDLLAQDVLKIRPALPVILCTGYSEQIDQKRALSLGIRKYIQKPVVMSELEKCVQQLLADE